MALRYAVAAALAGLALAGCSGDDPAAPTAQPTSDADCAATVPASVLTDLGWTPHGAPEATVRGCHREAEQGYVEVRDRPDASYARLCRHVDPTTAKAPAVAVDWLGADVTACALEPAAGVGTTRVLVREDHGVREITVAVLTATPRAKVRAAVAAVL